MSANFLRLYRELKHIEPDTKAIDATFEKERIQVLRTLGYNVGHDLVSVSPSKHHGKAARRFAQHRRLEALARDNKIESRKMRELQSLRVKVKEMKSIAYKIQECSISAEPIPSVLWAKNGSLYEDSIISDFSKHVKQATCDKFEHGKSAGTMPSTSSGATKVSPMAVSETYHENRRTPLVSHKDHSDNKWTDEERIRLNTIYHTLHRPKDRNAAAWDDYFVELSRRFKAFHPSRSHADIRSKALDMIRLRQMKEPGEREYWAKIKSGAGSG